MPLESLYTYLFFITSIYSIEYSFTKFYSHPIIKQESLAITCDREQDSLALIAFYDALNGDEWNDTTNWKSSNPIDTWYGVFDTDMDGCIDSIHLENNNLSGSLTAASIDFSNLKELILDNNNIMGAIPNEIANLNQLAILSLSDNQITNPNFSGLSTIPSLNYINFDRNPFESGVSISDLCSIPNLYFLSLVATNIGGDLPGNLDCFNNLSYLNLSHNNFIGVLPNSLGRLFELGELHLENNPQLTGTIPDSIWLLPNLRKLNLKVTSLSGEIPDAIANLESLSSFWVHDCNFSGTFPQSITNLQEINEVDLSNNDLDSIPNLSGLEGLSFVKMENNRLTFDDILPNLNIANEFFYANQALIFKDTTIEINEGDSLIIVLDIDKSIPDNEYVWSRNGTPFDTLSSDTLIIPVFDTSMAGNYICTVTNSGAPDLVLTTSLITIESISCRERDSIVLIELYEALGGENWDTVTNWMTNAPIDTWHGVFDIDGDGCIDTIDLRENNLIGILPESIDNFSKLNRLVLQNNPGITGSIPNTIGTIDSLEDILFTGCNLAGTVPLDLMNLSRLDKLDLSNNNFDSIPDLSPLGDSALFTLRIQNNKLTFDDILPNRNLVRVLFSYEDQANILPDTSIVVGPGDSLIIILDIDKGVPDNEYVWFRNGSPFDTLSSDTLIIPVFEPSMVGNYSCTVTNSRAPDLTLSTGVININTFNCEERDSITLDILYNLLDGENWDFTSDSMYYDLSLNASNQIPNFGTPWYSTNSIGTWHGIKTNGFGCVVQLVLPDSNLIGTLPSEIGALSELEKIYLTDNPNLLGTLPEELYSLSELVELDLQNTGINGLISPAIQNLSSLQFLNLRNTQFVGGLPSEIGALTELIILWITTNGSLGGSIPVSIGDLINLQGIQLNNNGLSGPIPDTIGNLENLEFLYLYNNQLEGPVPISLQRLTNLIELHLGNNTSINDTIPKELGDLESLVGLTLSNCSLQGSLPAELSKLSKLKFIRIFDNPSLGGHIPSEYGQLDSLQEMQLQRNNLDSIIPISLGQLNQLRFLYLEKNSLEDTIPSELGLLENLERLYLHENNLEGIIPNSLGDSDVLLYLDLRDNQLESCIPENLLKFCDFPEPDTTEFGTLKDTGFFMSGNLLLPWEGDLDSFCLLVDQIGAPCDDGDVSTINDQISEDCQCEGMDIDCIEPLPLPIEDIMLCFFDTIIIDNVIYSGSGNTFQDTIKNRCGLDSLILNIEIEVELKRDTLIGSSVGDTIIICDTFFLVTHPILDTLICNCNSSLILQVDLEEAITHNILLSLDGNRRFETVDFSPLGLNEPEVDLFIYNRNGPGLIHIPSYQNDWSGTFKDEQLPDGTYFYYLKDPQGKKLVKGHITILSKK